MLDGLTRENLAAHVVRTLANGSDTRADILLVEHDGCRAVVKDYLGRDYLFRELIGRWLVWRECHAYRDLAGVPGIPAFCRRLDRYALALEHVEGRNCAQVRRGELGPDFFAKLGRIVDDIHARGLAHCDLKKDTNVLVTASGDPLVTDFAAAFWRDTWCLPLRWFTRWLYGRFAHDDVRAIYKLKRKLAPELLTEAEAKDLATRGLPERALRFLRRQWRAAARILTRARGPDQAGDAQTRRR
ncbi:MAG: hypothetical protein ACE5R4_13160 [Armatimonadota bacterium]